MSEGIGQADRVVRDIESEASLQYTTVLEMSTVSTDLLSLLITGIVSSYLYCSSWHLACFILVRLFIRMINHQ